MKLNIQNTVLRITAGHPSQFPNSPLPQIALAGRSNVGKSSLINTLLERKALARVSSEPGKTITVNFYEVDQKLFIVDLPGYGYAKRSASDIKRWSALTDGYFTQNKNIDKLKLVIQLVDCKVGPTADDVTMLDWLRASNLPHIVVYTKTDKLSKTALQKRIEELNQLEVLSSAIATIPFSATTKLGKNEVWKEILSHSNL